MDPRKASFRDFRMTVPQTDTGRWIEKIKADEITLEKELGKKAAVTSGQGLPCLLLFW